MHLKWPWDTFENRSSSKDGGRGYYFQGGKPGAVWIHSNDVKVWEFVDFQVPPSARRSAQIHSSPFTGDWCFKRDCPTPGGMLVANKSYMNYMEGRLVRAY